jgi:hypothetical protein
VRIPIAKLRVEVANGKLALTRAAGLAEVTPRALRQLCAIAEVPLKYAANLPPTLLATNVNHGLAQHAREYFRDEADLAIDKGQLLSVKKVSHTG